MKKMIEEWKAKAGKAAGENTKVEDTVKKGEELQRKHLEKEMEFMQMKLAAAGLLD